MAGLGLALQNSVVSCTDGIIGIPCKFTPTGTPISWFWNTPLISSASACSTTVKVNGLGIVRAGDVMMMHPDGSICTPVPINHAPPLVATSATVFVEGKPVGRIGDLFNDGNGYTHTITTGSLNVLSG